VSSQNHNHDHDDQDIEQEYDIIEFTSQDEVRVLMDKALQRALTIPEEEVSY
jgi:hypothetical protein